MHSCWRVECCTRGGVLRVAAFHCCLHKADLAGVQVIEYLRKSERLEAGERVSE